LKWKVFDPSFDPQTIAWKKGKLLKDRPHRKVWLFEDFVIKAFRRKILGGDPAWKETKLGLKLSGLSPRVLAYGSDGSWRYVVTRRLGGPDLEEFLRNRFPQLERQKKKEFLKAFSSFVKALIERGLFQPDFHLRNVLLEEGPPLKLYLIDLHRAFETTYDEKHLLRQLAYILPPLLKHLSWWDIGRLTSLLSREIPALEERRFRQKVQEKAFSYMRKHFARRERRFRKTFRSSFPETLPSPRELFGQMTLVKNSRVTKTGYFPHTCPSFWIKAYVGSGLRRWQEKRLKRAFEGAYRLQNRGILTIVPLAYWKEKSLQKSLRGLIVYPYQPEARHPWGREWLNLPPAEQEKLLWQWVRFLWEIHERGVFHGDAKISNFFCQKGTWGLFDLDAVRFSKRALSRKDRLKDLATLAFSLIWLSPEKKEELSRKVFTFYAFLSCSVRERDFRTFQHLVEKRLNKRFKKEKKRAP